MLVEVVTDNHIAGSEALTRHVEATMEDALARFGERVTRVEVHLHDDNSSAKSGDNDKRCAIEARLAGLQPINITHRAASIDQALDGAAEKLERAIEHTLGRLEDRGGRMSYGGDQTI